MGGLLYKDFISVQGKKMCVIVLGFVILFTILRIAFPGYKDLISVVNEDGEIVEIVDSYFVMGSAIFVIISIGYINQFVGAIVDGDQKNKIINYLSSMPLSKNAYIASKYVFIMVVTYVAFSVYSILSIICKAFCDDGVFLNIALATDSFAPSFYAIAILMSAIELPLFICLGHEKAMMIKIALWLVVAISAIGYLFFGDLSVFEKFDFSNLVDFVNAHSDAMMLLPVFSIVLTAIIYYLSYRITCFFKGREVN